MCFSAKVKTPSVDTTTIKTPDPAPLTEGPEGIAFGDSDSTDSDGSSSEVSGLSSLKNSNDSTSDGSKTNTTSGTVGDAKNTSAKKVSTGTKSSIRKSIFSKK